MNLPVVLNRLDIGHCRIHVLRDDLLQGGTKERAALPYLMDLVRAGYREFVYASPFCGFAQVALAAACRKLDLACHLFCVADATCSGVVAHEFTELASSFGARVTLTSSLDEAEQLGGAYSALHPGRHKIPLGFADSRFERHMAHAGAALWQEVVRSVAVPPRRVWLPVGSATLLNCLRPILPPEIEVLAVNVQVLDKNDLRISSLGDLAGVRLFHAAERFAVRALCHPPIPSNLHYDAKLWSLIRQHGQENDLWWNVAR